MGSLSCCVHMRSLTLLWWKLSNCLPTVAHERRECDWPQTASNPTGDPGEPNSDVNLSNFRLHIRGGRVPTLSWFFLSVETSWHRRFHHEAPFIYLHVFHLIFIMFISAVCDLYWWTQWGIFFSTCYCPIYSGRNRSWSWEGGAHRCKKRQKKWIIPLKSIKTKITSLFWKCKKWKEQTFVLKCVE